MGEVIDRLKTALADRYRIDREIGRGGMATVYLAEDLRHHRKVAVKVLRPDLAATLGPERFLREIEIAAQLQHPNILPLLDSGDADDFLYYVMPYVDGQSLRERLAREGALPVADAVRILRDVVDALTAAHAHGVVHRDIKPENVLLSGRHALVTDFGVAKAVSEATGRQQLTTAGVALGTPAYMAPEQASADPHVDHRVDIYAVGAMAYELLTGRPVFMGTTPQMVLSAHMADPPEPVTKHRDTVPAALEAVVMRCLEKQPADRWQSAEELLPQLEALTTPSGGLTPTDTRPVAPAPWMRSRVTKVGVAGAATVLTVGVVAMQLLTRQPITVTTSNIRAITSDRRVEWHPSLSPDGSQVAFMASEGGREVLAIRSAHTATGANELVPAPDEHTGDQQYPDWSSDGEFVRFRTCDGGRCAWSEVPRLGGSARPLVAPDGVSRWSPDGSLAVLAEGDTIYVYSVEGDSLVLAAVHPVRAASQHSFAWSPDGSRLAYVAGNVLWRTSFNTAASSIWSVDLDGDTPVRVTGDESMDVSPVWLDDDHLLFVSNRDGPRELYVVDVGPRGPRGTPRKVPGVMDPHSIAVSSTGRTIAFARATERQNIRFYPRASFPAAVADGQPITDDNAVIEEHDISPDGEWIAYDQNLSGTMDIYKRPLAGGRPTILSDGPTNEWGPKWSPDGTEIAFYAEQAEESLSAVMVISAQGGNPVRIVNFPGSNSQPDWSPDGLSIAFNSYGPDGVGPYTIWIVSRDGVGQPWEQPVQLNDTYCLNPAWAPDGQSLVCAGGGQPRQLMLISRTGEILQRLPSPAAGFEGVSFHPHFASDGSAVVILARTPRVRGIWRIPLNGSDARLIVGDDSSNVVLSPYFSFGPDGVYATVEEIESDIVVADLEW